MTAVLRAEGLSKRFGGLKANDNVSLSLQKGQILGLIGPNGAGKATCFSMLAGSIPPTSGRVFLEDEETGRWTFVHHPFTGPIEGHEDLIETDPGAALSQHYDLIWNGWELGSGSIRIHRQEIQERVFRAMGMSDEEARAKFGWFLDALRMGAPPHGGFALGIERFVALFAGESNIREVIAFPKTASGSDPLTGAPAPTTQERLDELGISLNTPKA